VKHSFLTALLISWVGYCLADIPQAAKDDPRYKLGYLVVTYYSGVTNNGTGDSLAGLQAAVNDAYSNNLVALFPSGTYVISDSLRCRDFHVASGTNTDGSVKLGANPCQSKAFILQGSRLGARPVIKLADTPVGNFGDTNNVRPLLMFRLYQSTQYPNQPAVDPPDTNILGAPTGYQVDSSYLFNWELRYLDFDCNGHAGAIGVVFPSAQGSLIANVRVNATNAFAGFYGLPGRNWGAVNIEVNGGRYGIRTGTAAGSACAGSTILGARLIGQTIAAIDHDDFVPMVMAGFEITKADAPAITVKNSSSPTYTAWNTMTLLDGTFQMTGVPNTNGVINNPGGKNLYIRNVYVTGATNLVKSASLTALTGAGTWSRIDEYSYTDQRTTSGTRTFTTRSMIDGVINTTAERVKQATPNSGPPPDDLFLQHLPVHGMPVYEGVGSPPTIVVTDPPYNAVPGDALDDTAAIQLAIDDASAAGHGRVMIPKFNTLGTSSGAFLLTGTLVLRSNTVLFGAAKDYVSELRTHSTWRPTAATDIVQSEDNASGSTYVGNLAVTTDITPFRHPFTFLHWRAGRASETFNLRADWPYDHNPPINSNFFTCVRYSGNAGGRHFFFPEGMGRELVKDNYPSGDQNRSLRITGTTQPLWLYGFNLEGGLSDQRRYDAEITGAANIRWLGYKREGESSMLLLSNVTNFALYSAGAMREALPLGEGQFEIIGDCANLLFANVLVQSDEGTNPVSWILMEALTGQPTNSVTYPEGVSFYKRGTIDDEVMRLLPALPRLTLNINGSDLQLNLAGAEPGYPYQIQTSTNLVNWSTLRAVVPDGTGAGQLLHSNALAVPRQFYRAAP